MSSSLPEALIMVKVNGGNFFTTFPNENPDIQINKIIKVKAYYTVIIKVSPLLDLRIPAQQLG